MTRITDRLSVEGPDENRFSRREDCLFIVRLGDGAPFEFWLRPTEASALIRAVQGPAERPPALSELVTCSLRDPDQVVHLARLDCQHEAPHLIAACGAFQATPPSAAAGERGETEGSATDWSIAPISYQSGATMKSAPSTASAGSVFAGGHTPRCLGGCKCDPPSAAAGERGDEYARVTAALSSRSDTLSRDALILIQKLSAAPSGDGSLRRALEPFAYEIKAGFAAGGGSYDKADVLDVLVRVAASLLPAQGQATTQSCRWTSDDDGTWHTACGHAFVFNDGGPAENHFRFCGYCGAPVLC